MNTKNYFKDMYTDFFDVESLPKIEIKEKEDKGPQDTMASLFDKINNLPISSDSKDLLKKIIEYMRKYHERIETNYIPFRLTISVNNNKVTDEIKNILYDAGTYFDYIDKKETTISMYKLDKVESISDFGLINITDLTGINLEEDKVVKKFLHELTDYLNQDSHMITIISGKNEEITAFFLGREDLRNNYFDLIVEGANPDTQDVYNYVLEHINITDEEKVTLLDYITSTYNKDTDYLTYQNDLIKHISFNKKIPEVKKELTTEEVFADLNELVGLEKVKKVLYELVDMINLKEKAGDSLKIKDVNLHMVFLGNPGTGKTTIARLIANILYNLKYVKENKLVEVSVKDLVAEYVGQTAPKTMSVIEKAMNGVLFIDEAYALAVKEGNSYNAEAIATLIQAMENYRDKLVVIFAGYTKEMQDFLDSNSGITSRIGYTLEFDDYTTDELIAIFKTFTDKAGFIVTDDAIAYLREIIEENRDMKNFGNARFVRNIYEKTIIRHAANVKDKKQKKILKTITKDDINTDNLILK